MSCTGFAATLAVIVGLTCGLTSTYDLTVFAYSKSYSLIKGLPFDVTNWSLYCTAPMDKENMMLVVGNNSYISLWVLDFEVMKVTKAAVFKDDIGQPSFCSWNSTGEYLVAVMITTIKRLYYSGNAETIFKKPYSVEVVMLPAYGNRIVAYNETAIEVFELFADGYLRTRSWSTAQAKRCAEAAIHGDYVYILVQTTFSTNNYTVYEYDAQNGTLNAVMSGLSAYPFRSVKVLDTETGKCLLLYASGQFTGRCNNVTSILQDQGSNMNVASFGETIMYPLNYAIVSLRVSFNGTAIKWIHDTMNLYERVYYDPCQVGMASGGGNPGISYSSVITAMSNGSKFMFSRFYVGIIFDFCPETDQTCKWCQDINQFPSFTKDYVGVVSAISVGTLLWAVTIWVVIAHKR